MPEPVPALGYGPAAWVDFDHNWRKVDGDFLQYRSILRYETTVARDAISSPQLGMTIYNAQTDRLEVRVAGGGTPGWSGLYSVDGLIIEAVPTNTVRLRHKDSAGSNGMVFTSTQISTSVPLVTAGGEMRFEASGLTVSTGIDAKLTTDADSLNSDTLFQAPGLISTGTLNVATTSTLVGAVTTTGTLTTNGLLTANNQISLTLAPTATSHATRKDYVDSQMSTRVAKSGDTMTNFLTIDSSQNTCLRLQAVTPLLEWRNTTGGTRYGWINASAAELVIGTDVGDIVLASAGGQVRTYNALYTSGGNNHFFGQAPKFIGSSSVVHLDFYPSGSDVDTPGTLFGWVGYGGGGTLHLLNGVSGGNTQIHADANIMFIAGGPEQARISSDGLAIGKTSTDLSVEGHVLWQHGVYYNTRTGGNTTANMYLNRLSGASGERWIYFEHSGAAIGSIYQNGTTGTIFATTCDYRTKTLVGPIVNAVERVKALKPWRVTWNGDPERGETDDFMAHEVAEVVPDAVIGDKDAVDDAGKAIHQQMGESRLVPLITAALQDVIGRLDAVERNLFQVSVT